MNCFDDIPEENCESYPCDNAGRGGNITKNVSNQKWECDHCNWIPPQ